MAAVKMSERARGKSLNARSYLNHVSNSAKADQLTYILRQNFQKKATNHGVPIKHSSANQDVHLSYLNKLQNNEKSPQLLSFGKTSNELKSRYLSPCPGDEKKLEKPILHNEYSKIDELLQQTAELKIKNEKIRLFYQQQIANLQNVQEQLRIENTGLSNSIQGLFSQLQDARFIIQRLYLQMDSEEQQNSPNQTQLQQNSDDGLLQSVLIQQSQQFQTIMQNTEKNYLQKMELQSCKLEKIMQKINKMKKNEQSDDITSSVRQLDPKTIITELKQDKSKLQSQVKQLELKVKIIEKSQNDQQSNKCQLIEEQFNEFKNKQTQLFNQLTEEKNLALQQVRKDAQEKIYKLENQLVLLMDDIEKKSVQIDQLEQCVNTRIDQHQMEQLSNQLIESGESLKQLHTQFNELKIKEQSDQNIILRLNKTLKQQEKLIEEYQLSEQHLLQQGNDLKTNLDSQESNYKKIKMENQQFQSRLSVLQAEVDMNRQQQIEIQALNLRINKQNQTIQSLIQQSKVNEDAKTKEVNEKQLECNQQLSVKEKELHQLQFDLQNSLFENKNIQQQIEEITEINKQLQTQIEEQRVFSQQQQKQYVMDTTKLANKHEELESEFLEYKLKKEQLNDHLQQTLSQVDQLHQKLCEEQQQNQHLLKQLSSLSENKSLSQPNQDLLDIFDVQQSPRVPSQIDALPMPDTNEHEDQIAQLTQQIGILENSTLKYQEIIGQKEKAIDEINSKLILTIEELHDSLNTIKMKQSGIDFLKEQLVSEKNEKGKTMEELSHLKQKCSTQLMLISNLQKQLLDIEAKLEESDEKQRKLESEISDKIVVSNQEEKLQRLIIEKEATINLLQEELRSIHEQIEQKMNKSALSNRSKRSQNQIKFEMFADLDPEEENQCSDTDDDLLFEKIRLEKLVVELTDKVKLLEENAGKKNQRECNFCEQHKQDYQSQLKQCQILQKQIEELQQNYENQLVELNQQLKVREDVANQNNSNEILAEQIENKNIEIDNLREELRKIHEQIELQMNKSVLSNRSKRSQNQINFDQFGDLQDDSHGSEDDDDKEELEKIIHSNLEKNNQLM